MQRAEIQHNDAVHIVGIYKGNLQNDCDISNLSVLLIEQKGCISDTLDVLEIARARKNGKTILNEKLEFNISPWQQSTIKTIPNQP